ncbi:MAG TPA: OPT family oligopeptide transporter [Kofleriaceae bacterium]|nr:OPT family oligopeptide transporter [Kofleriaceae bacterium]
MSNSGSSEDPELPSAAARVPRRDDRGGPGEDPEAVWLRDVYQPDAVNLTARAVIVGMLIGVVMCISNLYVFFKTGWSMGVTITAAILAWGTFKLLAATRLARRPFGALENNALTTVASGAGYMTGGGNMAAYGALMMIPVAQQGVLAEPSRPALIVWFAVIAALGVFVAIPIKRQLINKEGVAFPTGTATATTIRSLHASGGSGARQAKALGYASLFGAGLAWLRDAWKLVPDAIPNPIGLAGHTLAEWTLTLKTEVVLIGAGALMSFRTGWSLLLGGVLTYGVLAPALLDQGLIQAVSYKEIVKWSMWPGAGILVGSGLTQLALDYRSLGRAFSGLGRILRKDSGAPAAEGIAAVESPEWWFPAAFAVLAPIIVLLMVVMFEIPAWAGIIAVVLAVLMGFVAARVTGETDVTPTKALGPVTQMAFGAMAPGALPANIMGANVTGGAGLHAADLLTTLKTGWLLGGKPRHQVYAQLFGVLVGATIVVPAFKMLFPDPAVLGSKAWPAPSCVVWKGVSEVVVDGVGQLPHSAQVALVIGLLLGAGLTLLERIAPKHLKAWLPSPNGLGIAMVVPGSNSLGMFLGAAIAELLRRTRPQLADAYTVPIGSGFIAGESLMGVAIIVLTKIAGLDFELDL